MVPHLQRARRVGVLLLACALALALAGCEALPRSAPLASELDPRNEDQDAPEDLIVDLTADVAALVSPRPARGFPDDFLAAGPVDTERLGVGDSLDILVWEPGGGTLFGSLSDDESTSSGAAALPQTRVDASGRIFVPFVGEMRAAGLKPSDLRNQVRQALSQLADRPEVDIRVSAARSRMVTFQGAVSRPGVYMIDRGFTRLTPMLALAGGASELPGKVEVSVRRGRRIGAEMLEDIYLDPALDIALRPDDVVVLNPIRERFLAIGASSAQAEIVFPTRELTLLSAISSVAGLRDFDADPQGVFVLRFEDPLYAEQLLDTPAPANLPQIEGRPIIYRADLTTPEGLFAARTFLMRDGDAIVASNAPLTELRKFLQIFTSVLTPVQQSVGISTVGQ